MDGLLVLFLGEDLVNVTAVIRWLATASGSSQGAVAVALVVVLVALWKAGGAIVRKARGLDFADVLTVLIALAATVYAGSGNWKFLGKAMHYGTDLRAVLVCVFEGAVVVEGLRSRRNIERYGTTGRDGVGLWILTCVSGLLSVSESDTVQEALGRLVVPLVAAWLWERLLSSKVDEAAAKLAVERAAEAVPSRIRWRVRPERIAVWLRLADAADTDLMTVQSARQVAKFLRITDRERDGWQWPLTAKARAYRGRMRLVSDALRHGDPTTLLHELSADAFDEAKTRLGVARDGASEGASKVHLEVATPAVQDRDSGHTSRASGKRSSGGLKRGSRRASKRMSEAQLMIEAERLNAESTAKNGRPVSQRTLQRELHIGQPRATALVEALASGPVPGDGKRVEAVPPPARIALVLGDPIRRNPVNGTTGDH